MEGGEGVAMAMDVGGGGRQALKGAHAPEVDFDSLAPRREAQDESVAEFQTGGVASKTKKSEEAALGAPGKARQKLLLEEPGKPAGDPVEGSSGFAAHHGGHPIEDGGQPWPAEFELKAQVNPAMPFPGA